MTRHAIWGNSKRSLCHVSVVAVTLLIVFPAYGKTHHINWRQPQQIVKLASLAVGDVPGHLISVGESRGKAIFSDGEVATVSFKYLADYTHGTGPFWGYSRLVFKDRSVILAKYQAFTTADPHGRSSFKGKFSFINGTGRFNGIRGGGYCTGGRRVGHAQGAKLVLFNFATYSLPM
jgi:hypothetical protein